MKTQSGSSSRRTLGIVAAVGLICLLGIAFALKQLFNRPTDVSLRYIPADAAAVITFDLTPGPSQVVAFKSISDSLKRNGLTKTLQDAITSAFGNDSLGKDLRPLIKGGFAVYIDGNNIKQPSDFGGFMAASLTDASVATEALKKHGPVQYYKGLTYVVDKQIFLSVLDDQLLVGNSEKELYKAKQVKEGDVPAIGSLSQFQTARKQLASDSNFVCYVAGKPLADIAKVKTGMPDWMAFGISVRDGGLEFTSAVQTDLSKNPSAQAIASAPALRSDLFDVLPSGSYGVVASSDFGIMTRAFGDQMKKNPSYGSQVSDLEKQFTKATGLSVEDDLLKASQGDGVIAVYPSDVRTTTGVDLLVMEDDKNGSDPAGEFRKYEAFAEKSLAASGPKVFVQKTISGGEEYMLGDKFVDEVKSNIGTPGAKGGNGSESPLTGKTIAVAIVGKTLIASSSQALLDRAVTSYESKKDSLSSDPNYAPYLASVQNGSHDVSIVSVSRIAQAVKNAMGKSSGNEALTGFLNVLERLKQPLTMQSTTGPDGLGKGTIFIPMDYAALIDAISKASHPQAAVPAA